MATKTMLNTDSTQTAAGKTFTAPIINGGTCGADPTAALGIVTKQYADALLSVAVPTGTQLEYDGTTAPSGFLTCDGSAVSRSTYAGLFSIIGTTFGAGDGSTTFNLPNANGFPAAITPRAVGSGSTRTHEGAVIISGNQSLAGIHYYSDFTLNAGVTLTIPAGSGRLAIIATGTITINAGTISGVGGGLMAGPSLASLTTGTIGNPGTAQPGGGGAGSPSFPGGAGGPVLLHGLTAQAGGVAGGLSASGGIATALSGSSVPLLDSPLSCFGGATGGEGGGDSTNAGGGGGRGGASLILMAPTILLQAGSSITLSGSSGNNSGTGGRGGGGGGGAGNYYARARSYTDSGCTFTQAGGAGGTGTATGGTGAAGIKQINLTADLGKLVIIKT